MKKTNLKKYYHQKIKILGVLREIDKILGDFRILRRLFQILGDFRIFRRCGKPDSISTFLNLKHIQNITIVKQIFQICFHDIYLLVLVFKRSSLCN